MVERLITFLNKKTIFVQFRTTSHEITKSVANMQKGRFEIGWCCLDGSSTNNHQLRFVNTLFYYTHMVVSFWIFIVLILFWVLHISFILLVKKIHTSIRVYIITPRKIDVCILKTTVARIVFERESFGNSRRLTLLWSLIHRSSEENRRRKTLHE